MTLSSVTGAEAFGSASFATPYGGLGAELAVSFDPLNPFDANSGRWITPSGGITWGAKADVGSVGVRYSNTRIGLGFDGHIRTADASGIATGTYGSQQVDPKSLYRRLLNN